MPGPGLFTKKTNVIQDQRLYYITEPPPRELWLEHDFMLLSLKQMKLLYKLYIRGNTTTLCDDDIVNLEICYSIKKEQEIQEKKKNIPFMKKPNHKDNN